MVFCFKDTATPEIDTVLTHSFPTRRSSDRLLRKSGIEVAFVTARNSAAAAHRARDLGVRSCVGVGDKLACVERLATELGIDLDQVSFLGDDLPDLRIMRAVGLAVPPASPPAWQSSDERRVGKAWCRTGQVRGWA